MQEYGPALIEASLAEYYENNNDAEVNLDAVVMDNITLLGFRMQYYLCENNASLTFSQQLSW